MQSTRHLLGRLGGTETLPLLQTTEQGKAKQGGPGEGLAPAGRHVPALLEAPVQPCQPLLELRVGEGVAEGKVGGGTAVLQEAVDEGQHELRLHHLGQTRGRAELNLLQQPRLLLPQTSCSPTAPCAAREGWGSPQGVRRGCPCPQSCASHWCPYLEAGPLADALPAGPHGQRPHEGGHALGVEPALLVHVQDVQLDQLPRRTAPHAEVEPGPEEGQQRRLRVSPSPGSPRHGLTPAGAGAQTPRVSSSLPEHP